MGTGQAYAKLICSARTRGGTTNDIDLKEQRREKVDLVRKRKLRPNLFAVVVNTLLPSADHCRSGPSNTLILRRIEWDSTKCNHQHWQEQILLIPGRQGRAREVGMGCSCDHPSQTRGSCPSPLVPMSAELLASQKSASRRREPGVVPVHPGLRA